MKHLASLTLAIGLFAAAPLGVTSAQPGNGNGNAYGRSTAPGQLKKATRTSAPELDATLAGSGLVLLLGGAAILFARRRKGEEHS